MKDAAIDDAIDAVALGAAELSIEEHAVAPAAAAARMRRRVTPRVDSLQARVDAENVYVLEDLKRIATVTGILLVSLAIAWVLFVPLDLLGLY